MKQNRKANVIWEEHTNNMTLEELKKAYKNPALFQLDLKETLDAYEKDQPTAIIEVGCETGITSLLLSKSFKKTLLDNNPKAIKLCKEIFHDTGEEAAFIEADMFNMPFDDNTFDIVFNSGVLEHFERCEIINALREYKRIVKEEGIIVIGVPNHYSIPYRTAYLTRIFLDKIGLWKWPFPEEFKLYNLQTEIDAVGGIELIERYTVAKKSIYNWWDFCPSIKWLLMKLDKRFDFEGYLTIMIIKKNRS